LDPTGTTVEKFGGREYLIDEVMDGKGVNDLFQSDPNETSAKHFGRGEKIYAKIQETLKPGWKPTGDHKERLDSDIAKFNDATYKHHLTTDKDYETIIDLSSGIIDAGEKLRTSYYKNTYNRKLKAIYATLNSNDKKDDTRAQWRFVFLGKFLPFMECIRRHEQCALLRCFPHSA
jgi:hypothetical protein